jgi:hypothetical protein
VGKANMWRCRKRCRGGEPWTYNLNNINKIREKCLVLTFYPNFTLTKNTAFLTWKWPSPRTSTAPRISTVETVETVESVEHHVR